MSANIPNQHIVDAMYALRKDYVMQIIKIWPKINVLLRFLR